MPRDWTFPIGPEIYQGDKRDVLPRQEEFLAKLIESRYTVPAINENWNALYSAVGGKYALAVSEIGWPMVSWADKVAHTYNNKRRRRGKLSKFLASRLGFSPQAAGEIACGLRCAGEVDFSAFELLSGDDITQAYEQELGGHSCMTEDNAELVEIYARNPDQVGLLVYKDENRALLWLDDDRHRMMVDRPYPETEANKNAYRQWARANGAVFRDCDPLSKDAFFVTLQQAPSGYLPYMDTMRFGLTDGDKITVSNCKEALAEKTGSTLNIWYLTCTEGGPLTERRRFYCSSCDCTMTDDGGICYLGSSEEPFCFSCYESYSATCDGCGDILHINDVTGVGYSTYCETCREDLCETCDQCGHEYERENGEDVSFDGLVYCCCDCAIEDGNFLCPNCDEWTQGATACADCVEPETQERGLQNERSENS